MKKIIKIFNKLGPGLLFAGTAIGVSHLVQSTKAGAEYGFGITWALLLAIILKYPFFKYAPKYSLITGESILHGYQRLNSNLLPIFFLITLCTMFTIQTAVTIVTAGIANSIFGNLLSVEIWTVIIITFSFLLLLIGKYNTLDKLIKYLILALAISTILSFFLAGLNFNGSTELTQVFPSNSSDIIFLIAFMGWMPAPLDVSVWNSLWSIEKRKQEQNYSLKNSMFDFDIGYFGTAILGICFIGVGYFTIYGSTETLSDSAGIFSNQLIKLYTISLGDWSYYLIAFAALSTMLSTTITALDASPRAMGITTELILNKKLKHGYLVWLTILAIGTIIIFFAFSSKMGLLIKIATILSFLTAPFYAIINYILISSKHTPIKNRPSLKMHILSILGIFYLLGFSVLFLFKGF
tara:strand:+ start:412 stop:1638 length:1227 start_codon:yes stop_codon:yes gene_type:complete